jgi:hypothetical protein
LSAPTLASRIRVSDDVLFQELQDESVLLDLKSGTYFGLDAVGTRMWQLIVEHKRLDAVAQAIAAEYEVSEARCTEDLLSLVTRLGDQGLVTIG